MSNYIETDQNRRKIVRQHELKRLEYKSVINDLNLSPLIRYKYVEKLNKLPKNSSPIRIRNRCVITGRGRSVFRFCKLSRIMIRELASQGLLPGVKKSSW